MTRAVTHKRLLAAIAIGLAFVLTPMVAQAAGESSSYWEFNDYWVDQLSNEVVPHPGQGVESRPVQTLPGAAPGGADRAAAER